MLSMQIGGKPVNLGNPGEVEAALNAALIESVKSQIHDAISVVCDPAASLRSFQNRGQSRISCRAPPGVATVTH